MRRAPSARSLPPPSVLHLCADQVHTRRAEFSRRRKLAGARLSQGWKDTAGGVRTRAAFYSPATTRALSVAARTSSVTLCHAVHSLRQRLADDEARCSFYPAAAAVRSRGLFASCLRAISYVTPRRGRLALSRSHADTHLDRIPSGGMRDPHPRSLRPLGLPFAHALG